MKQLKDYLHLYLGCECIFEGSWYELVGIITNLPLEEEQEYNVRLYNDHHGHEKSLYEDVKPLLRPLSDMTDEELLHAGKIFGWHHLSDSSIIAQTKELMTTNYFYTKQTNIHGGTWVDVFHYLLSRHLDLFDLIPDGIAIDKTLTPTP